MPRIVGTGIDLCEVRRIEQAIGRSGRLFLDRVFTPAEIEYAERAPAARFQRYAARFAAKEAGMKAIGTGWQRGVGFRDFEVTNDAAGKPSLNLSGNAAQIAAGLGASRIHLSLTHTNSTGMASVILEAE
ncbi:MAG: holo-[acyl-carrier-protein] synthase [Acidobacteria bacterium]|nr:holo-[acyl-carrier-protein] synthase [Acidobacteriota bacterium]